MGLRQMKHSIQEIKVRDVLLYLKGTVNALLRK